MAALHGSIKNSNGKSLLASSLPLLLLASSPLTVQFWGFSFLLCSFLLSSAISFLLSLIRSAGFLLLLAFYFIKPEQQWTIANGQSQL